MPQKIQEQVIATMDKNAAAVPNVIEAFRDALDGIHVPRRWTHSETEVKEMQAAAAMQQQTEAERKRSEATETLRRQQGGKPNT